MIPIATPAQSGPPPTMAAMLERAGPVARQMTRRFPDLASPPDLLAREPGRAAGADTTLGRMRRA